MPGILLFLAIFFSTSGLANPSLSEKLVKVLNSQDSPRAYIGSKVTVEAKDVSILDCFRLFGLDQGLKVTATEKAAAKKVSLTVKQLPWDQALDIALQMHGLKARLHDGGLQIVTLEEHNELARKK